MSRLLSSILGLVRQFLLSGCSDHHDAIVWMGHDESLAADRGDRRLLRCTSNYMLVQIDQGVSLGGVLDSLDSLISLLIPHYCSVWTGYRPCCLLTLRLKTAAVFPSETQILTEQLEQLPHSRLQIPFFPLFISLLLLLVIRFRVVCHPHGVLLGFSWLFSFLFPCLVDPP